MDRGAERGRAASCVGLNIGRSDGDEKLRIGYVAAGEVEKVGFLAEREFAVGVVPEGSYRSGHEDDLGLLMSVNVHLYVYIE